MDIANTHIEGDDIEAVTTFYILVRARREMQFAVAGQCLRRLRRLGFSLRLSNAPRRCAIDAELVGAESA